MRLKVQMAAQLSDLRRTVRSYASHIRSHAELSAKSKYGKLRTDGAALDWYDYYLRGMRAIHAELNGRYGYVDRRLHG